MNVGTTAWFVHTDGWRLLWYWFWDLPICMLSHLPSTCDVVWRSGILLFALLSCMKGWRNVSLRVPFCSLSCLLTLTNKIENKCWLDILVRNCFGVILFVCHKFTMKVWIHMRRGCVCVHACLMKSFFQIVNWCVAGLLLKTLQIVMEWLFYCFDMKCWFSSF